ncbi:MAG: TSUP family transporter [Oligoflexia bacterium]|nr:TSUP family transporter [Oligoflexia bacterium]
MPLSLDFFLALSTFFTSLLSGIFGMAGGMVLMGILSTQLGVSHAMIYHGIAQSVSNGSRSFFLRQHILLSILLPYTIGSIFVFLIFYFLTISLPVSYILIAIGLFPFISRIAPKKTSLNILKKPHACLCGIVITIIQLLAGASGPILDMFYLQTNLTKEQIVANKSFTQTLGHFTKITYYMILASRTVDGIWVPSLFSISAIVFFSLSGTYIGLYLLKKMSHNSFYRWSNWLVLALGTVFIIKGLVLIF